MSQGTVRKHFKLLQNHTNKLILPIFFKCSVIFAQSKILSGILNLQLAVLLINTDKSCRSPLINDFFMPTNYLL